MITNNNFTYTLEINKFNALNLSFTKQPDYKIIQTLKTKGFKYYKPLKVWSTFKFTKQQIKQLIADINPLYICVDDLNKIENDILKNNQEVAATTKKAVKKTLNKKVVNNADEKQNTKIEPLQADKIENSQLQNIDYSNFCGIDLTFINKTQFETLKNNFEQILNDIINYSAKFKKFALALSIKGRAISYINLEPKFDGRTAPAEFKKYLKWLKDAKKVYTLFNITDLSKIYNTLQNIKNMDLTKLFDDLYNSLPFADFEKSSNQPEPKKRTGEQQIINYLKRQNNETLRFCGEYKDYQIITDSYVFAALADELKIDLQVHPKYPNVNLIVNQFDTANITSITVNFDKLFKKLEIENAIYKRENGKTATFNLVFNENAIFTIQFDILKRCKQFLNLKGIVELSYIAALKPLKLQAINQKSFGLAMGLRANDTFKTIDLKDFQ